MSEPALAAPSSGRIVSMDQFRGYTVLGMFIVNYLGHFDNVFHTFLHNDYYFSYADTIMPAFIFAVGFSFRLTIIKRLAKISAAKTYLSYFKRSIALILVSFALWGMGFSFDNVNEFYVDPSVPMHSRQYQQFFGNQELDEDNVKSALRTPLEQAKKYVIPDGEPKELSEAQISEIDKQVDEQYAKIAASREEYKKFQTYKNEVERLEDQDRLKTNIARGLISEKNLDEEQKELLNAEITLPEYSSAPYFWGTLKKSLVKMLKSTMWETLAIIGVTQLLVLPFINLSFWWRFGVMLAFGFGHVVISEWFNWQFFFGYTEMGNLVYVNANHGLDNWMGEIWGTGSNRGWDGGIFGTFSWGVAMLAGSLCYDLMNGEAPKTSCKKLLLWGAGFILFAYGASCLATFYDTARVIEVENKQILKDNGYDVDEEGLSVADFVDSRNDEVKAELEALLIDPAEVAARTISNSRKHAASPVVPPFEQLSKRPLSSFLAPLPFMKNPDERMISYWMMQKRFVSLPFITFAAGFAFLVSALFVVLCDIGTLRVGVFRTFGMNPLAAYAVHEVILHSFLPASLPENSGPWLIWCGLLVFLLFVYMIVRSLEKQNIFVRM